MIRLPESSLALRTALSLIPESLLRDKTEFDEELQQLLNEQLQQLLSEYDDEELEHLLYDWKFWARPKQLPPEGDWATWLVLAGRGFGKTRTGAEWVHQRAMDWPGRWIALIAKTPADARDYMIEGPGGFLKNIKPSECPTYEVSKRRLTWPNGSWATIYSDEEPDQLRGYSGDTAWLDEFAKWRFPQDCWDNLNFGMREASNDRPRRLITTTPRPIPALKTVMKAKTTVTVTGTSHENRDNLDPTWYRETILEYENTPLGKQEVHAKLLEEASGALWTREILDSTRVARDATQSMEDFIDEWKKKLKRIVVALDPAAKSGQSKKRGRDVTSDVAEHGIVVAGRGHDDHGYILEDITERCTVEKAARLVIRAYDRWMADKVIGEVNNGGDWIGTTIQYTARAMHENGQREESPVAYKSVTATKGKQTRAEPVSTLHHAKKLHIVGVLPELEDQLCTWDPIGAMPSPDRLDAKVWAVTELLIGSGKGRAGVLF